MLVHIVYLVLNIYALGLLVYAVLSWLDSPQTAKGRTWLATYYEGLLRRIRDTVKPVRIGDAMVDFSPAVLLVALIVIRELVVSLLTGLPWIP